MRPGSRLFGWVAVVALVGCAPGFVQRPLMEKLTEEASEAAGVEAPTESAEAETPAETEDAPTPAEVDAPYDFESGDRVLFEDDFSADAIGDFPRSMEHRNGSWDVVEWNGRRWLRNTGPRHSALAIALPETLPEAFTIEFEAYFPHGNQQMVVATTAPEGRVYTMLPGNAFRVGVEGGRTGIIAPGGGEFVKSLVDSPEVGEGPVAVQIMVKGQSAKMYVGARRVANVSNAVFERSDRVYFENVYFASDEFPMLIGSVRVAAGDGSGGSSPASPGPGGGK